MQFRDCINKDTHQEDYADYGDHEYDTNSDDQGPPLSDPSRSKRPEVGNQAIQRLEQD